jgi:porin
MPTHPSRLFLIAAFGLLPLPSMAQTTSAQSAAGEPLLADAGNTQATAPTASAGPLDSVRQVPLFGKWRARQRLAERGIQINIRDVVEPAANTAGYKGTGFSVVQHIDIGAVLDLDKLGLVKNGTVRIVMTDRIGDGINSTRTGSYIQSQAFYGQGKNVRFNELSYEQTFLANRLSIKGGFYPMGNDFGKLPYTCNFTNNGNCGHPLGPIYGSGWRDDPTGQWGGRVKWSDPSGWYVQVGVYDVNTLRNKAGSGFDFNFHGTTGAFIPWEAGYSYGKTSADYAGTIRIGGYYDTSRTNDMNGTGATVRGRSGLLIQAAQQIWKPHPDTVRGIAVFAVATLADRKTGLFRTFYELGSSWRGILASRSNDILSLSWTEANINSRVAQAEQLTNKDVQTREQMWELNYSVQAAPWLLLRPAIQYISRPGGYASRPDTFVFTGHIQIAL